MTDLSGDIDAVAQAAVDALQAANGIHPGFRPAHAKGILVRGTFRPAASAIDLTSAPHAAASSTPVTIRFSDFAGIPTVADNDVNSASPRGCAIRFHVSASQHTDIVAHSTDGFPVRTAEDFVAFLRALAASGPDTPQPAPIEVFLASHPSAKRFLEIPKPIPISFATENYFGVNAFRFKNAAGKVSFGRYRIVPEGGTAYLASELIRSKTPGFLAEEMEARLAKSPARLLIQVQIASPDDTTDDATVQWPSDRTMIAFGTLELESLVPKSEVEQRLLFFDPMPRISGIEASADPLIEVRSAAYLKSARLRGAVNPEPHKGA